MDLRGSESALLFGYKARISSSRISPARFHNLVINTDINTYMSGSSKASQLDINTLIPSEGADIDSAAGIKAVYRNRGASASTSWTLTSHIS